MRKLDISMEAGFIQVLSWGLHVWICYVRNMEADCWHFSGICSRYEAFSPWSHDGDPYGCQGRQRNTWRDETPKNLFVL